jgi:two-component system response regulator YesN
VWKVLIADDEPKIRRGLRKSIESLRPDMTVVAEAEDGEAALVLEEKEKPDILIIDIRMPMLDGLELIERINRVPRDRVIIVLSGHDEFEYARKALHLKVFEYVLKPVSRDVLASVLSRAEAELAGTRRQSQYLAWAREQLEKNLPLIREQFLRDWVRGRLSRSEIDEQAGFLELSLQGPLSMAVIHVVERFPSSDPAEEKDRRLAIFAVRTVVEEMLRDAPLLAVFQDERENIVAIAGTKGGQAWMESISRIESRVTRSLAHALIVAGKQVPGGAEGIPETYDALAAEIGRKASFATFVVLAQSYIDAHSREADLSLETVAAEVEISPGYLSRTLKQETGFSFVDYLTRVRITKAVQLMQDPAMKIYEVAEAVGYQSQHYFSRAFKRVFGRSPVEFRKGGG